MNTMDSTALHVALHRLRRKLTFWRVVAIGALAVLAGWAFSRAVAPDAGEHIARLRIDGFILGKQEKIDLIEKLAKKKNVRAVIVRINSPGGSTAGAEAIYRALKRLAKKKPVVTVMDSVAASGGYMVALAGERMLAGRNTITGSIGVIMQWPELNELLGRVGVRVQTIRSGPLKALPNSLEPTPQEAREVLESMVREAYDWFVQLVARRRGLDEASARRLADGRIYSGLQAVKLGLVDELGDEHAARAWLREKYNLPKDIRVISYRPRRPLLQQLGLPAALAFLWRALGADATTAPLFMPPAGLDGMLSVWHPRPAATGGR